jgi:hypothetical protein
MPDPRFKRGARPSPAHKIKAAPKFRAGGRAAEFCIVPARLDMWGNDQYGDCVTAEEAFAKACHEPEIFIDANTVISWARSNGYLNGADLTSVMDSMIQSGFAVGSQKYNDGRYSSVNYRDENVLQTAIAVGPVKIAIDANALPNGAGNDQGWYALGGGNYPNTDHSVALCGYGSAQFLYSKLGVPLPSGLSATTTGYLLYTWSTIGFVDHPWLLGTCTEAWVRQPTTVGVPPLPDPVPPTPIPPTPIPPTPPDTRIALDHSGEIHVHFHPHFFGKVSFPWPLPAWLQTMLDLLCDFNQKNKAGLTHGGECPPKTPDGKAKH